MSIEGTTIEFKLPIGYEDEEGAVHKTVTMRKVKNSDIVAIQKDQGLKAIAAEKLGMEVQNPVVAMRVNAHVVEMFGLLFTRVVLRLGTIDNPGKRVFAEFFQEDMSVMMTEYARLNGVDLDQVEGSIAAGRPLS